MVAVDGLLYCICRELEPNMTREQVTNTTVVIAGLVFKLGYRACVHVQLTAPLHAVTGRPSLHLYLLLHQFIVFGLACYTCYIPPFGI